MKKFFVMAALCSCSLMFSQNNDIDSVSKTLDLWHQAAAEAKLDTYLSLMTPDAVFLGTDATEMWNLKEFGAFAKPYFDKGKSWNFKPLERHVYFNAAKDMAWFDELLDTQMKICRGSGVLRLEDGQWKIAHYVLSMTIPNEKSDAVVKIKAPVEDAYIQTIRKR